MKPVNQTIYGNCVQACIASIFEFELSQVPNFMMHGVNDYDYDYDLILSDFCDRYGLKCLDIKIGDNLKELYSIGVGLTHTVVCYEGVIIHDPVVSDRDNDEILSHMVFVVKDPSKFIKLYQRG